MLLHHNKSLGRYLHFLNSPLESSLFILIVFFFTGRPWWRHSWSVINDNFVSQEDPGGGGQWAKHDGTQDLLHHPRLLQGRYHDKGYDLDRIITTYDNKFFFKEHALQELRDVTGRKVSWSLSSSSKMSIWSGTYISPNQSWPKESVTFLYIDPSIFYTNLLGDHMSLGQVWSGGIALSWISSNDNSSFTVNLSSGDG